MLQFGNIPISESHYLITNHATDASVSSDLKALYYTREETESRFLTAHQHKTGHSVPFEVKNVTGKGKLSIRW